MARFIFLLLLLLLLLHGVSSFQPLPSLHASMAELVFASSAPSVSVFGNETLDSILLDYSQATNDFTTFHVDLAPDYRDLTKSNIKEIDDDLKIMIAGVTREIRRLQKDRSWESILSMMLQNPLLEPMDKEVQRASKLTRESHDFFDFSEHTKQLVLNEVKSWFANLVIDTNILKSTRINIDFFAKLVAHTGAAVKNLWSLLYRDVYNEQCLVDIGILRYPTKKNPHFELYRISITAWTSSERILFYTEDHNGISGLIQIQKFKPDSSVISMLPPEIREKAIKEAITMFDGPPFILI